MTRNQTIIPFQEGTSAPQSRIFDGAEDPDICYIVTVRINWKIDSIESFFVKECLEAVDNGI